MTEQRLYDKKQRKLFHIELLRIIACFFVIYTHTEYHGYYLFSTYPDNTMLFWSYLFFTIFAGIAVPCFFMISGALMLHRSEEPLHTLWLKRVLRYAILLVAVCFLYYFQRNSFQLSEINIKEFIIILYSYSSGGITWFLYSYLAYLILLPVLSVMAKNMKDAHFIYIFIIALFYNGVIPVLEYAVFQGNQSLNPSFSVGWIAEKIVIYPLMGYYLEHRMNESGRGKWMVRLWIAAIIGMLISCTMTVYKGRIEGAYIESQSSTFFSDFALVTSSAVYLTAMWAARRINFPNWLKTVISGVGQNTLGIYVLHQFVMWLPVADVVRDSILKTGINPMLASVFFCLLVMTACYGITVILKQIPGVKKIL